MKLGIGLQIQQAKKVGGKLLAKFNLRHDLRAELTGILRQLEAEVVSTSTLNAALNIIRRVELEVGVTGGLEAT